MTDIERLKDWKKIWNTKEKNLAPKLTVSPSVSCGEIKRNVNAVNGGPPLYYMGARRGAVDNSVKGVINK